MPYDADHFRLARLARRRKLRAERMGEGVWRVSSFSSLRGGWHKVVDGACSCPAVGRCTHSELAVSEEARAADPITYRLYCDAERSDLAELMRAARKEAGSRGKKKFLHATDREVMRARTKAVLASLPAVNREPTPALCPF